MTMKLGVQEKPAIYKVLVKPAVPVVRLGQLLTVIRGVTYKKEAARSAPAEGLVALLRATNIQQSLSFDELVYVPANCVSETQLLRAGDVLVVASSGSRTVVGKAAPLTRSWKGSFGAFCFALRPNAGVDPSYIAAFLRSPQYRDRASDLAAGTNINNLRATHIEETPIPLPTVDRQREVVTYLDEQLSRLDASVAALHRVQANLKRYRASVLKSACEGRLVPTEAELAREEGRDFETGAQLLHRILADRRSRLSRKGKYNEPASPSADNSQQLPDGWCLASLDQLSSHLTSGSRDWSPFYDRGSCIFLMAQNVRMGALDLAMRQRVDPPKDDASRARSQVEVDDLLVTIVGANAGDICRVHKPLPEHFVCQSVALLRPVQGATSKYLEAFLVSAENGQKQFDSFMYGQGRPHLSFDQLRATVVPLPPLAEQHRIVAEADRRLSLIRVAEAQVAANLARAQRLRQSILQAAFTAPASH